jgi:hypothetical protein
VTPSLEFERVTLQLEVEAIARGALRPSVRHRQHGEDIRENFLQDREFAKSAKKKTLKKNCTLFSMSVTFSKFSLRLE